MDGAVDLAAHSFVSAPQRAQTWPQSNCVKILLKAAHYDKGVTLPRTATDYPDGVTVALTAADYPEGVALEPEPI